jgi:hypothetical protein
MTADEIRDLATTLVERISGPPSIQELNVVVQCEIAAQLAELNAHLASIIGYEGGRPEIKGIRTRTEILK